MDPFLPKVEVTENDLDYYEGRLTWNPENTRKLIALLESECHELWSMKHPGYKNKTIKRARYELLADTFGTTVQEIVRKVHNLRTQFNNELRKIRRRNEEEGEGGSAGGSNWEYFDALTFLKAPNISDLSPDPLELEAVNLEFAEFQAREEEEFRNAAAGVQQEGSSTASRLVTKPRRKLMMRVAATAPLPLPASAGPHNWPDQPSIRPSSNADEAQIFGDFVASELRTLRSNEARRKLKRMIQLAILKVGNEEDTSTKPRCRFYTIDSSDY